MTCDTPAISDCEDRCGQQSDKLEVVIKPLPKKFKVGDLLTSGAIKLTNLSEQSTYDKVSLSVKVVR